MLHVQRRSNTWSNGLHVFGDWKGRLDASPTERREGPPSADPSAAELPPENMPSEGSHNDLVGIVTVTSEPDAHALASALTVARGYAEDSKAANTRRAYRADWRTFEAWCDVRGLAALPA